MRKMGFMIILALSLMTLPFVATPARALGETKSFIQSYGAQPGFEASSIQQAMDGGFIISGLSSPTLKQSQTWLMRLDERGSIVWQKAYGGPIPKSSFLGGPQVKATADGGFVVESTAVLSSTSRGAWIFKVDSRGDFVWQEAFTGEGDAKGTSIDVTSDGGFVATAVTSTSLPSAEKALVIRLDSTGGVIWQRGYNGTGTAIARSVGSVSEGGFVVAGETSSAAWLLRLDSEGGVVWQRSYPTPSSMSDLTSVHETSDTGFVAAGRIISFSSTGASTSALVFKLGQTGNLTWQRSYGAVGIGALAFSIQQTSKGDYIVAGGAGPATTGGSSAVVLKLDASGNVLGQTAFSPSSDSITLAEEVQTSKHGFTVAGFTVSSASGSLPQAFVMNLDKKGEAHSCETLSDPGLVAGDVFAVPASIDTGAVDITGSPTTTTFLSTSTSANATVACP